MTLFGTLARMATTTAAIRLCRLADAIEREPPAVDPAVAYPPGSLGAEKQALAGRLRTLAVTLSS